jgi:hypothetical protein
MSNPPSVEIKLQEQRKRLALQEKNRKHQETLKQELLEQRNRIDLLSTRIAKKRGHKYWLVRTARNYLAGKVTELEVSEVLEQVLRDDIKRFPKFEDSLLRFFYVLLLCITAIALSATFLALS